MKEAALPSMHCLLHLSSYAPQDRRFTQRPLLYGLVLNPQIRHSIRSGLLSLCNHAVDTPRTSAGGLLQHPFLDIVIEELGSVIPKSLLSVGPMLVPTY